MVRLRELPEEVSISGFIGSLKFRHEILGLQDVSTQLSQHFCQWFGVILCRDYRFYVCGQGYVVVNGVIRQYQWYARILFRQLSRNAQRVAVFIA